MVLFLIDLCSIFPDQQWNPRHSEDCKVRMYILHWICCLYFYQFFSDISISHFYSMTRLNNYRHPYIFLSHICFIRLVCWHCYVYKILRKTISKNITRIFYDCVSVRLTNSRLIEFWDISIFLPIKSWNNLRILPNVQILHIQRNKRYTIVNPMGLRT